MGSTTDTQMTMATGLSNDDAYKFRAPYQGWYRIVTEKLHEINIVARSGAQGAFLHTNTPITLWEASPLGPAIGSYAADSGVAAIVANVQFVTDLWLEVGDELAILDYGNVSPGGIIISWIGMKRPIHMHSTNTLQ